mmetsp:Transcript_38229/g.38606  ORF Transcript_38229/g.38606 Transcript_38229/m.38606 type:complete len:224 (+) Transcript_38229:154-825(+)
MSLYSLLFLLCQWGFFRCFFCVPHSQPPLLLRDPLSPFFRFDHTTKPKETKRNQTVVSLPFHNCKMYSCALDRPVRLYVKRQRHNRMSTTITQLIGIQNRRFPGLEVLRNTVDIRERPSPFLGLPHQHALFQASQTSSVTSHHVTLRSSFFIANSAGQGAPPPISSKSRCFIPCDDDHAPTVNPRLWLLFICPRSVCALCKSFGKITAMSDLGGLSRRLWVII